MIAAYPSPFDSPSEGPVVPLVPPEQKGTGEKKGTGANQGFRSIQVSKCQHTTLSSQEIITSQVILLNLYMSNVNSIDMIAWLE